MHQGTNGRRAGIIPRACIVLAAALMLLPAHRLAGEPGMKDEPGVPSRFIDARNRAVAWLEGQMVPGKVLARPQPGREGMIMSFGVAEGHALYGKSSLYDNALAIIALDMAGRTDQATRIAAAVCAQMDTSPEPWFFYNLHNAWPEPGSPEAVSRTGASAWLGCALVFHCQVLLLEDCSSEGARYAYFARYAKSLAQAIMKRQVRDAEDRRYGLVPGGLNSIVLSWDPLTKSPLETFKRMEIDWVSTEHSIDTWFFLNALAVMTGKDRYRRDAALVRAGIMKRLWNEGLRQFSTGMTRWETDTAESLDCASWGSIFLQATGEREKALAALKTCGNDLNRHGDVLGYRPYNNAMIYDTPVLNDKMFPGDPEKRWNSLPFVWPEGSLGVALAAIRNNQVEQWTEILDNIIKMQLPDGGIPYASEEVPNLFTKRTAVASAAWLVIAVNALANPELDALFWR